ncbi:MAG TPA: biotin-dependent carboxyltransferase family protein [Gammaproteobacteria bacterium]
MIEVLHPGSLTTLQDLGRSGLGHLGVPPAGAADVLNLRIANRLVGNPDGYAALEMTSVGTDLRFDADARIALTGGTLEAQLDGEPLPMYQTLSVKAGRVLHCSRITAGWRSYLAVAGGFDLAPVLGSRSTDTLSGLGPEPLSTGTQLAVAASPGPGAGAYLRSPPRYGRSIRLRVLAGPHQEWFASASLLSLRDSSFKVSSQSDRTGVRLEGTVLQRIREDELPSMGMVTGAIQVPLSGQAIVLLGNHGSTGGYPVIANVIGADLHLLAQLAPGYELRFMDVSRAEALDALREQESRLQQDLVTADAGLLAARALMTLAGSHASLRQAAVKDGNRRIRIRK